ncbi:oxygen-independent coproporphyrinogen III oxidase [Thermosynechococcus sp. B3]|uniref:oxygen-independent coproporphyrinogen III oxidase n=1 Tax=Thermosynechococcus sp. B3 TaxID=2937793 RepID=UPI002574B12B|nr:oxygen-independent coproporphyrinogen III oxidase [Thermosynechococcus sp. B3]WJI28045.1 oxygen-independent coproporphyrinogen III oxidase [Thermosynechococcus sp. B3]
MSVIQPIQFDGALLQKYDRPLPRYTSYPTAAEFTADFDSHCFQRELLRSNEEHLPLSLYVHIPFCQTACYFCGCNVIVTQSQTIAKTYLDALAEEIAQVAARLDRTRPVIQMHWGGGTPNYLTIEQVESLWRTLTHHFEFAKDAEISIEVNPRYINREYLFRLRDLGFNRISFGVQDFDPQVQLAVNRVQPETWLFQVMEWIRAAEFESVNIDLIYGLPFQTVQSFETTIAKTVRLDPDRIAVFNFAYLPNLKPIQKRIDPATLPDGTTKLAILQRVIETLTSQGYQYIGMDHFAKPTDELAIAQAAGTLKRNFQGYTILPPADLIGFGLTSISMLQQAYAQNQKHLATYFSNIASGQLATERGIQLHPEDVLRRTIIMELMCQFTLDKGAIARQFNLDFDTHFAPELTALQELAADGLIHLGRDRVEVTSVGRLLIRNVAALFDTYLQHKSGKTFSKAI